MMIVDFLAANAPWGWIIAGLVLLALELVVPGGFLVWLGTAGIVTGLVVFIQPMDWPWQWLMFAILSLASIFAWLRWSRSRKSTDDQPFLNRRAERFVGQEFTLDQPIAGGFGRLSLGDSVWRIAGPDLPVGQRIRIVGYDGPVLKVEPV
ncbi:NfeD family protein [Devosia sp. FJ2-5-3]|jgi:membrane protein implicated in regulation of membrane protease activity|uniref:NfeD family protein n=1 Tax=Devosia sp. FJ2-5-3 TaxID=2976680 RepID=UPI0023D828DA|nr:NfeD family protein [Devosia sp. FJ2-5-3]WEJ59024.1 NfeD family protein [Devosia sp. FJ2-5-3]